MRPAVVNAFILLVHGLTILFKLLNTAAADMRHSMSLAVGHVAPAYAHLRLNGACVSSFELPVSPKTATHAKLSSAWATVLSGL